MTSAVLCSQRQKLCGVKLVGDCVWFFCFYIRMCFGLLHYNNQHNLRALHSHGPEQHACVVGYQLCCHHVLTIGAEASRWGGSAIRGLCVFFYGLCLYVMCVVADVGLFSRRVSSVEHIEAFMSLVREVEFLVLHNLEADELHMLHLGMSQCL